MLRHRLAALAVESSRRASTLGAATTAARRNVSTRPAGCTPFSKQAALDADTLGLAPPACQRLASTCQHTRSVRHRLVDRQRLASSQQCEGCAAPPDGQCAAATAPAVARRASRWPVSVTGICVAPPACPSDFGATGHRSSHSDADGTGSDSTCQQAGAPLLSRSPGTSHRAAEHLGDWPGTSTMRASVRPRRAPTKARGARGEAPGAPHQSQGASTWSPTQISILVLRADDATYAWSTTRPPLRHRPLPGRRPPRAG